ncbi:MAG: lipopolysaccharide heptosyltransferase II [Phycisphaerales bacterium]|nr:lipopolysaccharide heptosyltransferase II [Phycisphaerales bacterium]
MKTHSPPRRLLVVLPNWVGDVVLATPVLAALRKSLAEAHICYLHRPYVGEIVAGCGWHDQSIEWPAKKGWRGAIARIEFSRAVRRERFDVALLLTNSFRSALTTWLAGVPRIIGYAREWRGWMLTDRLRPLKRDGEFVPSPMLDYYIKLAEYIGCPVTNTRLQLGISAEQDAAGQRLKEHYGIQNKRYAIINPGAAFGAAKCWLPERFAEVCDELLLRHELIGVIVGAAGEAALMRKISEAARQRVICCESPGTTLGSLKPLVRDAALMVCNDTGPRHYGNAFGIPVVTIFGPTFQEWTDTGYEGESKLQARVDCGPCMLRVCPLDHRCMRGITSAEVVAAAGKLIQQS